MDDGNGSAVRTPSGVDGGFDSDAQFFADHAEQLRRRELLQVLRGLNGTRAIASAN